MNEYRWVEPFGNDIQATIGKRHPKGEYLSKKLIGGKL